MTYTPAAGQNVLDLALQVYGSLDALVAVARVGGFTPGLAPLELSDENLAQAPARLLAIVRAGATSFATRSEAVAEPPLPPAPEGLVATELLKAESRQGAARATQPRALTASSGQNVLDLAVQATGSASGLIELLKAQASQDWSAVQGGQSFLVPSPADAQQLATLEARGYVLSTGNLLAEGAEFTEAFDFNYNS